MLNKNKLSYKGFSLVEIVLTIALVSVFITTLVGILIYSKQNSSISVNKTRAVFLAEEGLEAMRNIRDSDFLNLVDGTYGINISNGKWELVSSPDVTDIFTREIEIRPIDDGTKEIISTITWQQNMQRLGSIILKTQFTNWRALSTFFGDWSVPFLESNLEISWFVPAGLKIAIQGDYAYITGMVGVPNFYIIDISDTTAPEVVGTLNLPLSPTNITVSGDLVAISSSASSEELEIINVSDPYNPFLVGGYDASGTYDGSVVGIKDDVTYTTRSTGEFFSVDTNTLTLLNTLSLPVRQTDLSISGNYAYLSSSANGSELQIVDISNPSNLTLVGEYDTPGNPNALAVATAGDRLVLGCAGGPLYLFDITNRTSPILLTTATIGGDINAIVFGRNNRYVFLATTDPTAELRILEITESDTFANIGTYDYESELLELVYDSERDRLFIVTESNDTQKLIIIGAP